MYRLSKGSWILLIKSETASEDVPYMSPTPKRLRPARGLFGPWFPIHACCHIALAKLARRIYIAATAIGVVAPK